MPRMQIFSFCSGEILAQWKRWAWISALRRTIPEKHDVQDEMKHFIGSLGEIIIASVLPMCSFNTSDACDGNRTDDGFDLELRLRNRIVTIDVKTILNEDYRIRNSTKKEEDLADIFILIFVDVESNKYRIRGFSSAANFAKHAIESKGMYFLHKEHMRDFKKFLALVFDDFASPIRESENAKKNVATRCERAIKMPINKRFMRVVRNSVLDLPASERDEIIEARWDNLVGE